MSSSQEQGASPAQEAAPEPEAFSEQAAYPVREAARAEQQIFTSRLNGRPLLDGAGRVIGRVRDVIIWPVAGSEPPRALGLVVGLQRRSIFVPFGRIREVSVDGAHLLGGTVDLDPFTMRTGEFLASSLYGRRTPVGTVADVAIAQRELTRNGWEVTSLALSRGRGPLAHGRTSCRGPTAGSCSNRVRWPSS